MSFRPLAALVAPPELEQRVAVSTILQREGMRCPVHTGGTTPDNCSKIVYPEVKAIVMGNCCVHSRITYNHTQPVIGSWSNRRN